MRHCRNDHRPDPARRIKRGSGAAESLYGRSLWPARPNKMPNLLPFQTKLVQKRENLSDWDTDSDVLSLLDAVRNVKPDILIGVSGKILAVYGRDHP
ncbi:malic enzyme-like NAD(P)-binding protein [Escherichia coli]